MKAHELTSPFNEDEEIDWNEDWSEDEERLFEAFLRSRTPDVSVTN